MKWPREAWINAVFTSELPPLSRLVAVVYSRKAGSKDVVWVSQPDLVQGTGLSRNAARKALRALEAAGWLKMEQAPRQQFAAQFRMVIPTPQGVISAPPEGVWSGPSEGVTSAPSENPEGHLRTLSGGHLVTPGGHEVTPKYLELEQPPTKSAVSDLWMVVEANLPHELAQQVTRTRKLDDALGRLHADGWTPEALGERIHSRSWAGCQAGGVVVWLGNLPAPTRDTRPARPAWCGQCDQTTRQREDGDGNPFRCPTCHPDPQRLAS